MKHPALMRMMGVFLAVVSLLTILAASLGFRSAEKDRAENERQDRLLGERIEQASALSAELDGGRSDYDPAKAVLADRQQAHDKLRSDYRMKLGTYTATKAGLRLGREQLDAAAAALKEASALFWSGYSLFKKGYEAFKPIYSAYSEVKGKLADGEALYAGAAEAKAESGDGPAVLSAEQVLALAELEDRALGELADLLTQLHDQTPPDQRKAAEYVRQAMAEYNELAPTLRDFSVEKLAYDVSLDVYEQAKQAMLSQGDNADEALAAADRICEESFGLTYEELGQWLEEHEPQSDPDASSLPELSPEMTEMLLEQLPGDRDLLETAVGFVGDTRSDLSAKIEAFKTEAQDMDAAALLLVFLRESLDGAQRLLGLFGPTVESAWEQLEEARVQLANASYALSEAQAGIDEGYRQLEETEEDLAKQLEGLEAGKGVVERDASDLAELNVLVESYEDLLARYRTARAVLMSYEGVARAVTDGGELIGSARAELSGRQAEHDRLSRLRPVVCALTLAAGIVGFLCALGAFEKPRIPCLRLTLLLAAALAAAGEWLSVSLGRGLWYTSLFVGIFALLSLPIASRNKERKTT